MRYHNRSEHLKSLEGAGNYFPVKTPRQIYVDKLEEPLEDSTRCHFGSPELAGPCNSNTNLIMIPEHNRLVRS